jgi:hypothetical protein
MRTVKKTSWQITRRERVIYAVESRRANRYDFFAAALRVNLYHSGVIPFRRSGKIADGYAVCTESGVERAVCIQARHSQILRSRICSIGNSGQDYFAIGL